MYVNEPAFVKLTVKGGRAPWRDEQRRRILDAREDEVVRGGPVICDLEGDRAAVNTRRREVECVLDHRNVDGRGRR